MKAHPEMVSFYLRPADKNFLAPAENRLKIVFWRLSRGMFELKPRFLGKHGIHRHHAIEYVEIIANWLTLLVAQIYRKELVDTGLELFNQIFETLPDGVETWKWEDIMHQFLRSLLSALRLT